MNKKEELLKELKAYRDEMVARNYPFQRISDIITKWEMKGVKTISEQSQDEDNGQKIVRKILTKYSAIHI